MLSGFNPRTREGCDAVITVPITVAIPVSIHAPVRGATSITNFFRELIHVSIHAPVRGATCITLYNHTTNMIVSIHAPVRGATANNIPLFTISASFNPRTREGCDYNTYYIVLSYTLCFNPRTREGCDLSLSYCFIHLRCFNPRTREGCDLSTSSNRSSKSCFNPRTREGCDAGSSQKIDQLIVSIHAPVRGVTSYWYFSNITI